MQKRGRKTKADLAAVVSIPKGPRAPKELTAGQAAIWDRTVRGEPEDFFATQGVQDLLTDYCRHRFMADEISGIINLFEIEWAKSAGGGKKLASLLRLREVETRAAANLATKMRLTNQSRYRAETADTKARNKDREPKPWEM